MELLQMLPPPYTTILPALIGVWAGTYVIGMIVGKTREDGRRRLPKAAKFTMVGAVVAVGIVLWVALASGTGAAPYARWIVFGLVLGAVGDVILAGVFPIAHPFYPGGAAFALGHIATLMAILFLRKNLIIGGWLTMAAVSLPALLLAALVWEFAIRNPDGRRSLNTGTLFYEGLITVVTALGIGFSIQTGTVYLLGIGLGLFWLSDLLLLRTEVRGKGFPLVRDVVWILYSSGQMLIGLSILTVLGLFAG
jgi:hypothetical protein